MSTTTSSNGPGDGMRLKKFVHAQTEELLSNYGKIDILWLDGGWVCKKNQQDIDMPRIASRARELQPGLIIVDRTIHGPYENYQTPERTIPESSSTSLGKAVSRYRMIGDG